MDINELLKIKQEYIDDYNEEVKVNDFTQKDDLEMLNYMERNIEKIDQLIEIYSRDDIKYRLMRLERLYVQTQLMLSKKEFDNLSSEERISKMNDMLPDEWFAKYDDEKMIDLLELAICQNKSLESLDDEQNV